MYFAIASKKNLFVEIPTSLYLFAKKFNINCKFKPNES